MSEMIWLRLTLLIVCPTKINNFQFCKDHKIINKTKTNSLSKYNIFK